MLAWAAHLWAVIWLINIDVLDVRAFLGDPPPRTWMPVLLLLGVVFVVVEAAAIGVLRRRIRERLRELD